MLEERGDEGFESDEEHLISKAKNLEQERMPEYFMVPDAKPLLSKNIVDMQKPKVLIKDWQFFKEPPQLLSSNLHKQLFSLDKPHLAKPFQIPNTQTSIWSKYILCQKYSIAYLKYYKSDLAQLQSQGLKKTKLQLQRMCRNDPEYFSNFVIDLSFLTDYGTYLMRNLKPQSFETLSQKPMSQSVEFDSHFECGNLYAVFKPKQQQLKKVISLPIYQADLVLESDINTKGYASWFYFSIRSKERQLFKFNIVNMQKSYSLFMMGMKLTVFSRRRLEKEGIEWHHDGFNFNYYRNELIKKKEKGCRYHTLSFSYEQKYDDDIIFIAPSLPYSYSKLLKYLEGIEKGKKINSSIYLKRQNIGRTISSNECPVLTLTWKRDKKEIRKRKKIIGVIARQHPCQTVSSYVMEGFINTLLNPNNQYSIYLLQNYIFKIVPMVNIDGVIYGNSRCDISGTDINRRWTRNPNKLLYPVVAGIRALFSRLKSEEYEIDYFIDLHGHSRKLGSFFYACKTYDEIQTREMALVMSKLNSKFSFDECNFGLSMHKRETARGMMSDTVIRKKSMTLQTSFFGYKNISNKHFEVKDLHHIGHTLVSCIYGLQSRDPKMLNWESIKAQIKTVVNSLKKKINHFDQEEDSSEGSDSNPSEDQMNVKEKGDLFLDPTVAAKIGLIEVKVVQKKKEEEVQKATFPYQSFAEKTQQDLPINGFDSSHEPMKLHPSYILHEKDLEKKRKREQNKKSEKGIPPIKQLKSVTKTTPFKFSERQRSLSNIKKIQSIPPIKQPRLSQKKSISDLPKLEKKSTFWPALQKEYNSILLQRKMMIFKQIAK